MGVAFSLYGGISEQIPCNLHSFEDAAVQHWGAIYCLTPDNYEPVLVWNAWWAANTDGSVVRREAFENAFGFVFTERVDPLTSEVIDVIEAANAEWWDYYCGWFYDSGGDCADLGYPVWP